MTAQRNYKIIAAGALFLSLLLVTLGGVVHNTGSSLACPDWPLCFGQLMPPMVGQVAIEHSHRMLATLVGIFCILLLFFSFRIGNATLKKMSWAALMLVIFQGLLGGLTVLFQLPTIVSVMHLATSQLFLALLLWLNFKVRDQLSSKSDRPLLILLLVVFLQIILGAFVRHSGAGASCGQELLYCFDPDLRISTFWPLYWPSRFHMFHRFLACVVAIGVFKIVSNRLRCADIWQKRLAWAALFVLLGQIFLGLSTVATSIDILPVTLHLVFAMGLWLILLSLYFKARA